MLVYKVDIAFDHEAQKYYVARSDISGLHAEAKTFQDLAEAIRDVVPDLIKANHVSFTTRITAFLRGVFAPAAGDQVSADGINLRLSHDLRAAQ